MEKIKLQTKHTPARSNVIKVVDLKRFKPETDTIFSKQRNFVHISNNYPSYSTLNVSQNVDDNSKAKTKRSITYVDEKSNVNGTVDTPSISHDGSNVKSNAILSANRNKIKFRNCSHTPEELSKLMEFQDETLVKLNDMFDSREALREYLNENAKRWFYYYVCRNSKKNTIEFSCMCLNYTPKPRSVVLRRQKKRTTACPCKIRLSIDETTKKVVVYYVCNHHDHKLSESAFRHFPHAKYLPQQIKDEFLDLAYLGLDIDLIQKYMYSLVGLIIKRKDIWSYAYKFKRKVFKRTLTPERENYIKELILSIRDTYDDTFDLSSINKSGEQENSTTGLKNSAILKKRESLLNANNSTNLNDTMTPEDDLNLILDESDQSLIKKYLDANYISVDNTEVFVQYVDEEGILCDENGTPVTSSTAILKFINKYEYAPDTSEADFIEEGAVFNELAVNIQDQIYPLDWATIQEDTPDEAVENETYVEEAEGPDSVAEEVSNVMPVETLKLEDITNKEAAAAKALSDIITNCVKSSSATDESTGLYAEMDNFNKYYFVDHQYIKCEEENQEKNPVKYKHNPINRICQYMTGEVVCEEFIKAPNFAYCQTPFKICSGHEGLVLLTDPDAILPGARFIMHEVFLTYVNERANRWFFYYSLVESGKVPEYYVYKCVFGKHRVSKNAYRSRGLRKRANLTTQCPCQIRLRRLESDPTYLTVLYSCNHHDHVLNAQLFMEQPHSRRLPEHMKEEIKDLLSVGATFDVLRKYVTSETGLKIYDKYFHNVKVKMTKSREPRKLTDERRGVVMKKLKDLQEIYGTKAKASSTANQTKTRKRPSSPTAMKNQFTEVNFDDATQEFYVVPKMDDVAEEVCIFQTDPLQTHTLPTPAKRSRLETRLQNISSHEDTLLSVRKLQESVRTDHMRSGCEIPGASNV